MASREIRWLGTSDFDVWTKSIRHFRPAFLLIAVAAPGARIPRSRALRRIKKTKRCKELQDGADTESAAARIAGWGIHTRASIVIGRRFAFVLTQKPRASVKFLLIKRKMYRTFIDERGHRQGCTGLVVSQWQTDVPIPMPITLHRQCFENGVEPNRVIVVRRFQTTEKQRTQQPISLALSIYNTARATFCRLCLAAALSSSAISVEAASNAEAPLYWAAALLYDFWLLAWLFR